MIFSLERLESIIRNGCKSIAELFPSFHTEVRTDGFSVLRSLKTLPKSYRTLFLLNTFNFILSKKRFDRIDGKRFKCFLLLASLSAYLSRSTSGKPQTLRLCGKIESPIPAQIHLNHPSLILHISHVYCFSSLPYHHIRLSDE
jgi:hypothetical protein